MLGGIFRRTDSSIPVGFDITDRATLGASLIPATFAGALNSLVGDAALARVGGTMTLDIGTAVLEYQL